MNDLTTPQPPPQQGGGATLLRCRHCAATGIRNFTRRVYALEDHPSVDVIACIVCGDWLKYRPVTPAMTRAVPPINDRALATCHVAGCVHYISANPAQNKSGLCSTCSNKMAAWRANGSKNLPPLIRTATGYMTRAAFAALNPLEEACHA